MGLTEEILKIARDKLKAKTTKFFSFQGEVQEQHDVEAHDIQLQAVRVIGEMLDQFGSRSGEPQQQPSFVFVFPTWSKPPGPEQPPVPPGVGGAPEAPASEQVIDVPDDDLNVL